MSHRKQPPSLKLSLRRPAFLVSGLLLLGCVAGWTTMACNEDLGDSSEEATGADTTTTAATGGDLVIAQVYADFLAADGGGEQTRATSGFIELFNRGSATVKLGGQTLQTFDTPGPAGRDAGHAALEGEVQLPQHDLTAGQHFLIRFGDLDTPDAGPALTNPDLTVSTHTRFPLFAQGSIVLLDKPAAADAAADAGAGARLDSVSYGPDALALDGQLAPALDSKHALLRKSQGCQSTRDNKADFELQAPTPRGMHQETNVCSAADGGTDGGADAAKDASSDASKKDASDTTDGATHPANGTNPGENANPGNHEAPGEIEIPEPEQGNEPPPGGGDAGTHKPKAKSGGCSSTPASPNDAGIFGFAVAALALTAARRRKR